jgi:hypothetical protein
MPPPTAEAANPAFFIADHPALDFLNSVVGTGDDRTEFLTDDEQVLNWLKQAGLPVDQAKRALKGRRPGLLRAAAVALRAQQAPCAGGRVSAALLETRHAAAARNAPARRGD